MNMDERIKRINELYHISQERELTKVEKEEQNRLRREYIDSVKASLKGQLDNVDIQEKDGSITNLGEKVRDRKTSKNNKEIIEKKSALRKKMIALRNSKTNEEITALSNRICEQLFIDDVYKNAKTIFLYASIGNEVDTFSVFHRAVSDGKCVAFPKSVIENGVPKLELYLVNDLNQLSEGYKGILEPDISKDIKRFDKKADLCIVPGLCFDKAGNRLGYGKGFYDRFISEGTAEKYAAFAYGFQIIKKVPVEETDMVLDMIFTEERVYVCK